MIAVVAARRVVVKRTVAAGTTVMEVGGSFDLGRGRPTRPCGRRLTAKRLLLGGRGVLSSLHEHWLSAGRPPTASQSPLRAKAGYCALFPSYCVLLASASPATEEHVRSAGHHRRRCKGFPIQLNLDQLIEGATSRTSLRSMPYVCLKMLLAQALTSPATL